MIDLFQFQSNNRLQNKQMSLYVTRTGSCYHRGSCSYLRSSSIPITFEAAIQSYSACSRCSPPDYEDFVEYKKKLSGQIPELSSRRPELPDPNNTSVILENKFKILINGIKTEYDAKFKQMEEKIVDLENYIIDIEEEIIEKNNQIKDLKDDVSFLLSKNKEFMDNQKDQQHKFNSILLHVKMSTESQMKFLDAVREITNNQKQLRMENEERIKNQNEFIKKLASNMNSVISKLNFEKKIIKKNSISLTNSINLTGSLKNSILTTDSRDTTDTISDIYNKKTSTNCSTLNKSYTYKNSSDINKGQIIPKSFVNKLNEQMFERLLLMKWMGKYINDSKFEYKY